MGSQIKLKIKSGDRVLIIAGKDKGQQGRVISVDPKHHTLLVEGLTKDKQGIATPLNAVTKHRKARNPQEQGEKTRIPSPLHISKVMLIDPDSEKPTRVGRRLENGKLVRYAKATNKTIHSE
jgi:large subunit ribosomal protein L24